MLEACEGEMTGSTVTGAGGGRSLDARGLKTTPSGASAQRRLVAVQAVTTARSA
jgi:hypothetical protein